jgi:hypothetical protein
MHGNPKGREIVMRGELFESDFWSCGRHVGRVGVCGWVVFPCFGMPLGGGALF